MKSGRILSGALAAVFAAAMLPVNAALAEGQYGTWTEAGDAAQENVDYIVDANGNYTVMTALGLAKIANIVNGSGGTADDLEGKSVTLANEIDLSAAGVIGYPENVTMENSWIPIGSGGRFSGTFDGDGYSIENICFNAENGDLGLFDNNVGTIKNVEVGSGEIRLTVDSADSSSYYVGAISASNNGTIQDCINRADISIQVEYNSNTLTNNINIYTGGITGSNVPSISTVQTASVSECVNFGDLSCVGENSSCLTSVDIGGICGQHNGGSVSGRTALIDSCSNTGSVRIGTVRTAHGGGIAGYTSVGSQQAVISKSENHGQIINEGSRYSNIGGIIGSCAASRHLDIIDCFNTANVSGSQYTGGIIGATLSSSANIYNCFNIGKVSDIGSTGGILGYRKYSGNTISNCYYLNICSAGGIDGADITGQAEAKAEAQFVSGEIAYLLNGSSSDGVWKQTIGTDEYSNFAGLTVYYDSASNSYSNEQPQQQPEYSNTVLRKVMAEETTDGSTATAVLSEIKPNGNSIRSITWTYGEADGSYTTEGETTISGTGSVYFGVIVPALLTADENAATSEITVTIE